MAPPSSIIQNTTVAWTDGLTAYPAPTWTLTYYFRAANFSLDVDAVASGSDHAVTLSPAVTATFPLATGEMTGTVLWSSFVTDGVDRHQVSSGEIQVIASTGINVRSNARQIYDDLITAYKNYIASGATIAAYSIAGRSVTYKDPKNIIEDIKYWAAKVQAEEDAAAAAEGTRNPRHIGVRFNRI